MGTTVRIQAGTPEARDIHTDIRLMSYLHLQLGGVAGDVDDVMPYLTSAENTHQGRICIQLQGYTESSKSTCIQRSPLHGLTHSTDVVSMLSMREINRRLCQRIYKMNVHESVCCRGKRTISSTTRRSSTNLRLVLQVQLEVLIEHLHIALTGQAAHTALTGHEHVPARHRVWACQFGVCLKLYRGRPQLQRMLQHDTVRQTVGARESTGQPIVLDAVFPLVRDPGLGGTHEGADGGEDGAAARVRGKVKGDTGRRGGAWEGVITNKGVFIR